MQQASQGKGLTELIEEIDTKLTYGGVKKISEFEAELLDQIDEIIDIQIKMQRKLDYAEGKTRRAQEDLGKTDNAIKEYCSETTRDKILLARGWQFRPEKAKKITEAYSDKELLERKNNSDELLQRRYNERNFNKICNCKCNY